MAETAAVSRDPYAALRSSDYRWFIASLGLITLGLQMQGVVVGWQVYDRTGDPLALGLVGLSEALPFLAVALFGGHAADRLNRLPQSQGVSQPESLGRRQGFDPIDAGRLLPLILLRHGPDG